MSIDLQSIKIVGRNTEITNSIRDYIYKKIIKIDKYIPKISSLEIVITKEKYIYEMHIMLHPYNKKMIKLSCKDKNLKSVIDLSVDKLKTIAVKFKEKTTVPKKKHTSLSEYEYGEIEFSKNNIFVEKISQKEAIEKLKNSNEKILVFFNTDTNKFSLATKDENKIEITDVDIKG